ncbi:MAG: hypothetical protein ACLSB9_21955 [Hydrogeniiclostridium mannosilyticum]
MTSTDLGRYPHHDRALPALVQQAGTDGYCWWLCQRLGYALGILVGIIAVMVAFEAIRLVLKQCLQHGSLLKISMRLIFVLIVQYSMGLLMGVLRMFALRSVLESLLLFFLLYGDSLEPEVTQVMNEALEREIEMASGGLQHRYGEHQPRISRKDKVVPAELERVRSEKGGIRMDQTDKMRKISGGSPQTGALYILRIATIVLAVVSGIHSPGHGRLRVPGESGRHTWLLWGTGNSAGIEFLPPTFWMNTMGSCSSEPSWPA